jgi:hypothetical protein
MANSDVIYSQFDWGSLSRKEQLSLMDEYYSNNSLYEATRLLKHYLSVWNEDIRPLRTPVHRSVEFYTAKIAIGEPTVSSKSQSVTDAVKQIMEWSNFQIQKPVQVRAMSKYGDLFRKVVSENGKVWHEIIDSNVVTDFKEDARGFLTEIRMDTPITENGVQAMETEFWTVNDNVPYMAIWRHRLGDNATLEQIQRVKDPVLYVTLAKFGIDFIPFVRTPFQNNGTGWGSNCVEHALLKIDEANRSSTRLHQMLFRHNKALWAVSANQVMTDGTPIPAPKLKQGTNPDRTDMEMRDNTILYLPGNSTIQGLVPQIDYAAALSVLQAQEKELIQDLPELLYYSLPDRDLSGKALRTLLGAAIDRAIQAQANFVEGTVRLNQMSMTVGMFQGIFPSLGNFDDGSLAHSVRFLEPFPLDAGEKAEVLNLYAAKMPLKIAMMFAGFSVEEIAKVPDEQPVQANETVNQM